MDIYLYKYTYVYIYICQSSRQIPIQYICTHDFYFCALDGHIRMFIHIYVYTGKYICLYIYMSIYRTNTYTIYIYIHHPNQKKWDTCQYRAQKVQICVHLQLNLDCELSMDIYLHMFIHICIYIHIFVYVYTYMYICYGVATISRLLKIIGLFCRITSLL